MKTYLIFTLAGITALAAGYFVQKQHITTQQTQTTINTIPEFTFPDLSGRPRGLGDWAGKTLIVNFWATWCAPCREEMPEFIQLQTQLANRNVQFIGIAIDELQSVKQFLTTLEINYPILISGDAGIDLAHEMGNLLNTVPFTVVITPNGEIVHRQSGTFSAEALLKTIETSQ